jgi:hypothetical protein
VARAVFPPCAGALPMIVCHSGTLQGNPGAIKGSLSDSSFECPAPVLNTARYRLSSEHRGGGAWWSWTSRPAS